MTLAELDRKLKEGQAKASPAMKALLRRMKGLPFYLLPKEGKSFWYELGAPISQITGKPAPLHDYTRQIFDKLMTKKRVLVLKCRQSGLSEFALRVMLWLILSKQIPGVYLGICSTNIFLSIDMVRRMRAMLAPHGVYFEGQKETTMRFPHAYVQWNASEVSNVRGFIPNMVIMDEFAMSGFSSDLFATVDSFSIKKRDCYLLGITTASKIDSPAYELWQQRTSIYERLEIPWQLCVNKMFSWEQLERLKQSPSFSQEMECKWGFSKEGTTFSPESVDKAITLGKNVQFNEHAAKYLGIDIGLSSPFGFCCIQQVDGYAQVVHAEEIAQKAITGDHSDMVQHSVYLINKYNPQKVYIDGSGVSFIRSLKLACGDEMPYETQIERNRKMKLPDDYGMLISPINFSTKHRDMLLYLKMCLDKQGLAIPAKFKELIEFCRTCRDSDMSMIKKGPGASNSNHVGDALRLSLLGTEFDNER